MEPAVLDPGRADQHRRAAIGGLARERLDRGAAGVLERRLLHQIFRRVAGDEQFRKQHEIGAVGPGLRARGTHLRGIALDVAHGRIELGERDREYVETFGHGRRTPLQRNPNRSMMAMIQNAPAISSATPTAAEPMSLTRPICLS